MVCVTLHLHTQCYLQKKTQDCSVYNLKLRVTVSIVFNGDFECLEISGTTFNMHQNGRLFAGLVLRYFNSLGYNHKLCLFPDTMNK